MRNHTSVSIREVMQDQNLINIVNVGKLSVRFSLHMKKFIQERNLGNTVSAVNFSKMSYLTDYKRIHTRDTL